MRPIARAISRRRRRAALAVNAAINAASGARCTATRARCRSGDSSIAGDTIVGAFLIAFFTLLIVAPPARRGSAAVAFRRQRPRLPR